MKWYIAARFGLKEKVREIHGLLRKRGHEVLGDWTNHIPIKPYQKHTDLASDYSIEDVNAVKECEVFCLLSDEAGTGMYVELGVAILSNMLQKKPDVYVIGEQNTRSMFYFHPAVNRRATIDDVIAEVERGKLESIET
ncbi:MAG: hypothetical protein AABW64_00920 [Nanoarchaeota archaeon]